jgi:hypothetical protein
LRVRKVRLYEKIDIPRKAGLCVKDDRVSPHNEVSAYLAEQSGVTTGAQLRRQQESE